MHFGSLVWTPNPTCHVFKLAKGCLILKISKTGISQHSISGVAILVDQHIDKNCLIHVQFYSFKDSTKENKQS